MTMGPRLRKFALTAHITASVGWLGAVAVFLALALAGLNSIDPATARANYFAMSLTTTYVILPLCAAALLTGVVQALGTSWGLLRHYWIVTKLLITAISTLLLLLHMRPIFFMASLAEARPLLLSDMRQLRVQLVADAAAALVALLAATALSVYKPFGLTGYGRRAEDREAGLSVPLTAARRRTPWGRYIWLALGALLLIVVVVHLLGGGMGRH